MAQDQPTPTTPELAKGIALAELDDGNKLVGHVGEEHLRDILRKAQGMVDAALAEH